MRDAQNGSEAAFAMLVQTHMRRAYAVARAICATHEDAEDAVQDGFLHAYRALERFRPEQAFAAWLNRIVANAALDIGRRRKVRDADVLPETLSVPVFDPSERSELRSRLGRRWGCFPTGSGRCWCCTTSRVIRTARSDRCLEFPKGRHDRTFIMRAHRCGSGCAISGVSDEYGAANRT